MRHNTQIMAIISQNEGATGVTQTTFEKCLDSCYPQVCTQIENRYLIKIYDDAES